jgi:hypothetical protein
MLDNRELVAKRIKKQLERMAKEGTAGLSAHGAAATHLRPPAERPEASGPGSPDEEPLPHGAAQER